MMKKRIIGMLLVVAVLLSGCAVMNTQKKIAAALGVELPKGEEVSRVDSHGGFHNDGLEFTVLQFDEDVLKDQIAGVKGWHELPLSRNLETLLYGVETEQSADGPYVHEDGKVLMPEVRNGYWFFMDRHSESTDPVDDSQVFDRFSFNFIAAVYDTDTNRLYFVKYDT